MNLTVTAAPGHNILHLWLTIVTNYSAIFCYWICLFRSTGSVESVIHKMQEYILIQLIKRANRIPDFKMTVHQQEKLFVFLCSTIVLILDSPYFFSISFLLIPWLCVCYLQMIHNYMEHLERTKHQHAVTTAEPSDTSTSTRIRWVVSPVISWI